MNIGIMKKYVLEQEETNKIAELSKDYQVTIFCNLVSPNVTIDVATMQLIEAFHFKGVLVTNELDCLLRAKKCLLKKDLYYYCTDLDWCDSPDLHFKFMERTLLDENIKIICKNESQKEILEKLTNQAIEIVDDWSNIGEKIWT